MFIKKIKHYLFLVFLLSLICLNQSYAITLKNTYAFYNCPKTEISAEIKKFIDEKKHKLYKYDIKNGFYYFQPRYMGTYTQGNYILLGLKQINNDTFFYTQNNYASDIHRMRILKYLTQKGFIYAELKDKEMKNNLDSLANSFITDSNAQVVEAKEKNEITGQNKTDVSINNDYTNKKINQSQIIPEKLNKKDTKYFESVNRYAIYAFKNANFPNESSNYSSIDPNYEDVKKGIYLRHEKIIVDTYQIRNDKTALVYDLNNGKLKSIITFSTNSFPSVSYYYKYPNGNLKQIEINLSPVLSFNFNEKGEYINFIPYMKDLEKKIKGNWNPNHPSNEYSFHTLVLLKVNKKGELYSSKISKSSGDIDFDEEAINAVRQSAPFNPLPSFWKEDIVDMQFGFDMEQHRGYYYINEFLKNNLWF